jgi:diguanylate cyclase
LRALGKAVSNHIRPNDMAARYGGEEFAILMPNTALEHAASIAGRLRRAVRKLLIQAADEKLLPSITLSLGLSEMKAEDTLETLIASADAALYQAKQGGRNRVFHLNTGFGRHAAVLCSARYLRVAHVTLDDGHPALIAA